MLGKFTPEWLHQRAMARSVHGLVDFFIRRPHGPVNPAHVARRRSISAIIAW